MNTCDDAVECGPHFLLDIYPLVSAVQIGAKEAVCSGGYLHLTLTPLPGHPSAQDVT